MKKKIIFFITTLLLFPLSIFACDVQVESVYPNYDVSNKAIITTLNKIFGLKLNSINQNVLYEVTLNNTCEETATITDIGLEESNYKFFDYSYKGIEKNDQIPGKSKKVIFLNVSTNNEAYTDGVQEEYSLSLDYTYDVVKEDEQKETPTIIENIMNPNTITMPLIAMILFIIAFTIITVIKNKKMPNKFINLILIFILSTILINVVNAYDIKRVVVRGIVNFDEKSAENASKVTIDPNGGRLNNRSDKINILVENGTTLDLSDVKREKNTLTNWVYNEGVLKDDKITIKEGTVLVANWELTKHKLTLDLNGGTLNDSTENKVIELTEDSTYELEKPTKEHYKFYSWVETTNTNSLKDNIVTMNTEDVVVKAIWLDDTDEEFVVTLDANGGVTQQAFLIIHRGDNYELPTPTKTGYTFDGWYDENDKKITNNDVFNQIENISLSAKWNVNSYNLTLDYQTPGKQNKVKKIEYNTIIGELEEPTREGYIFEGWFDKDNNQIEEEDVYDIAQDKIIYAHWIAKTYLLEFDANGGVVSDNNKSVKFGEIFGTLPTPKRTGYDFVGWFTEEEGGTQVNSSTRFDKANNQTIYAHWRNSKETPYVVKHWQQKLSGDAENEDENNYVLKDTQNFVGETGSLIEPTPEKYVGFNTPEKKQTTINADGTTEVNYYYKRNKHIVNIETTLGVETATETKEHLFGEEVAIDYIIKSGYSFTSITGDYNDSTFIMPDKEVTITINTAPNKYTVSFDTNGGTINNRTKEVTYNETYGELESPRRTGYSFDGWYTELNYGTKITSDTKVEITNNQTLYAHWSPKQVSVIFEANGGTLNISTNYRTLYYGGTYGTLPTATKKGYTFIGWFTEETNGTEITTSTLVQTEKMHQIYAHYKPNEYTITFNAGYGTVEPLTKKVEYEGTYGLLPEATREGYLFTGWYTENDEEIIPEKKYTLTDNITLYAKYSKDAYKVTFDPNGGEISQNDKTVTFDEKYGELPKPILNGYTFGGWYTNDSWTNQITENTTVATASNHTLIAKWNVNTYTVHYDANEGTVNPEFKEVPFAGKYGELATPTRTGYTFDGWYTEKTSGDKVTNETNVTKYEDHTIYAHWTANTYTINFDGNGGTTSTESKEVTFNEEYGTLPNASRDGYIFNGWYTETTNGEEINETTVVEITNNQTLYAHWIPRHYVVTFDSMEGNLISETNTIITEFDSEYGELPEATKEGYTFIGWYADDYEGQKIEENSLVKIAEIHTLYAHYQANEYTIEFDTNGGTLDNNVKKVTYDSPYGELPIPEKEGYTFENWLDENDQIITSNKTVKITGTQTLYATYSKNTYTLKFNALEGSVNKDFIYVVYDEEYGELPEATRTGYTFDGWYTDTEWTTKITNESIVKFINTQTLYAKYEANKYTLNYNPNGGTVNPESKEITYDSSYGTLATPTRTGYTFDGWYTRVSNGDEVTSSNIVNTTTDITIHAHWTPNTYKVYYNANEGNVSEEYKEVTYASIYGDLEEPTRTGYTFTGWYTNKINGTKVNADTEVTITSNQTLYAHWEANQYIVTYNTGEGTLDSENNTKVVTYNENYGELPTASRTGYTFIGWYNSDDEKIESETKVTITEGQTLYAKYEANQYTVTLDPGSGTVTPKTIQVTYDEVYGTLPQATKSGYTFMGWYDEDGNQVLASTKVEITKNSTLTAKFSNTAYILTFDAGDGECNDTEKLIEFDKPYGTLPQAQREGYIFDGWYTDTEWTTKIDEETIVDKTGAQTLYAKYTIKTFEISFNAYGGTDVDTTVIATWGSEYGTLPSSTKTGYTFDGWYRAFDGNEKITSDMIVDDLGGNITLYAHWTANKYTITYEANGGELEETSKEITYDETYGTLATPTKTGYTFKGWYRDYSFENKVDQNTPVNETNNITIYAKWKANEYTLLLNPNGGSISLDEKTITYDQKYGELIEPTKDGYTFTGWYTEEENGEQITSEKIVKVLNDQTLYAHWTVNKYTITFNSQGGMLENNKKEVTYDEVYGELPEPSMEGHTFEGWYTDPENGTEITSSQTVKIKNDITLYAHWTVNKYTITLDPDGGQITNSTIEIEYGANYSLPEQPTKQGYTFSGWFRYENQNYQVTNSTIMNVASNHTLIAKWRPRKDTPYTVNHWKQKINGNKDDYNSDNYELDNTENLEGETGNTVRPIVATYEGFTSPSAQNLKILADGTASVDYYYTRNSYELTIDATKGIKTKTESRTVLYGEEITIEYTLEEGYSFDKITGTFSNTSFTIPANDVTINIHAIPNKYIVNFNPNEGIVTETSREVTYDSTYGTLPIPNEREGYTFKGWYTNTNYNTRVYDDDIVKITSDQTLYAKWQAVTANVTFDAGKGTEVDDVITVTYDSEYGSLPTSTRPGYELAGWYTIDGEEVTENTISKNITDQVLYAHWNLVVNSEIKKVSASYTGEYYSPTYKNRIKTITFENDIDVPEDAIISWNMGAVEEDSVKAYIKLNETSDENNNYYDLYIQGYDKVVANSDSSNLFRSFVKLEKINNPEYFDTSNVKNMEYMFYSVGSTADDVTLDIGNWDVSKVETMSNIFNNVGNTAYGTVTINTENWDTSSVTNMNQMFDGVGSSSNIVDINVSGFNTSSVTNMSNMFYKTGMNASSIEIDVSNFDTSKVRNMNNMFFGAALNDTDFTLNVSGFVTDNVESMGGMFTSTGRSSTIYQLDVSNFNTAKVINTSHMFQNAGLSNPNFTLDVSRFNTANVINTSYMFQNAGKNSTVFDLNVTNWAVSSVKNMSHMFDSAGQKSTIMNLDVSKWSPINVTDMSYLFANAGEESTLMNLNVSNWTTDLVVNMSYMFDSCGKASPYMSFDLSNWNTNNVTDMSYMFRNAGYSNPNFTLIVEGPNWKTNKVTTMEGMFEGTGHESETFNLSVNSWNTANVTTMKNTFKETGYSNPNFTLNLSNWTIERVNTMEGMFNQTGHANNNVEIDISSFVLTGSINLNQFAVTDNSMIFYINDSSSRNELISENYPNVTFQSK